MWTSCAGIGDAGALLLLSDSTNADSKGFTPSEQSVNETLEAGHVGRAGPGHHCHLRLEHLAHRAGDPGGAALRPAGGRDRAQHGQQRAHGDRPGLSQRHARRAAEHARDEQPAAGAGRHRLHGQPGRAELRCWRGWRRTSTSSCRSCLGHGRALGHADPRQRGDGQPHHRRPVPAGRRCDLLRPVRRARVGTRQPGRPEADAVPGAAEVLHPDARRIPPPGAALPAGA